MGLLIFLLLLWDGSQTTYASDGINIIFHQWATKLLIYCFFFLGIGR
jgi:hypothetical protein